MFKQKCMLNAVGAVAVAAGASAGTVYSFGAITANSVASVSIGEAQLTVDVDSLVSGFVDFTFMNAGLNAASIANVYIDDDANVLAACSAITNMTGVAFAAGGSPPNLPSGANIAFAPDFRFRANNPAPSNGVNPGEQVVFRFSLESGLGLADVLSALDNETLRLGMHVIAFANGASESFVNGPPGNHNQVVPLPSAAGLGFLALGALAAQRRRR